jgi:hypothetical protein
MKVLHAIGCLLVGLVKYGMCWHTLVALPARRRLLQHMQDSMICPEKAQNQYEFQAD